MMPPMKSAMAKVTPGTPTCHRMVHSFSVRCPS
jgi:hypothetical protein